VWRSDVVVSLLMFLSRYAVAFVRFFLRIFIYKTADEVVSFSTIYIIQLYNGASQPTLRNLEREKVVFTLFMTIFS